MKIYGFYHVLTENNWKEVVNEQINIIVSSGLYDKTEEISLGVLGKNKFDIGSKPKFKIKHRSKNREEFEFPTLKLLREKCFEEKCYVWYIHSKGVSRPQHKFPPYYKKWRDIMNHFVLEEHQTCMQALNSGCDVAGAFWRNKASHFAGNFWWAKSEYIKTLGPLNQENRGGAENWIGQGDYEWIYSIDTSTVFNWEKYMWKKEDFKNIKPTIKRYKKETETNRIWHISKA